MTALIFDLGHCLMTPGAADALELAGIDPVEILDRHARCDWSGLPPDDRKANARALAHGGRILSAYSIGHRVVWVITERDRSGTTILLPDEY